MQATKTDHTIILFFSNSKEKETRRRSVLHSDKVYGQLIDHTLQTIDKSALPYTFFDEKDQGKGSFGTKLNHAIQKQFKAGYERVIIVGNDVPDLKRAHITQAYKALDQHDLVVGRATDGGVYLLGVTKSSFNEQEFINLPWCTQRLGQSLIRHVSQQHTYILKEVLRDIDTSNDIEQYFLKVRKVSGVFRKLRKLFYSNNRVVDRVIIITFDPIYFSIKHNRGSPNTLYAFA